MQEQIRKGTFVAFCYNIHPLLYKLLCWIVTTNRCYLKALDEKLPASTEHQFIVKSTPPEFESQFQKFKEEHGGSFWAWHGSSFGNWHSILHSGLKNLSGTTGQVNGASYGPGIYLASQSSTSVQYSVPKPTWPNSNFFHSQVMCLALCEIINFGSNLGNDNCAGKVHRPYCVHNPKSPFFRVEEERFVVTRFLFLYAGCNPISEDLLASSLKEKILVSKDYTTSFPPPNSEKLFSK
eukprot:TRINITY_DN3117_c0_g1_i12.p1 TRINITY_DN3117_c0_g1~~TRINITY_DN3117_c0_g1_i12.p1  ORF type:complete len:237 (+),score=56.00 TRINITY_DN3117_c0_g1_i12:1750-2460(+)